MSGQFPDMLDFGYHTTLKTITRDHGGKSCEHTEILCNFIRARGRKSSKDRGSYCSHENKWLLDTLLESRTGIGQLVFISYQECPCLS